MCSKQTAPHVNPPPDEAERDLSASVSVAEAARRLALPERGVRRAIADGNLVAVKEGRGLRIPVAAIAVFAARRQDQSSARPALRLVEFEPDDASDPIALLAGAGERITPGIRLPAPLAGFVGRQLEVEAIVSLLAHANVRLLTLLGVGGVGKTRLAIQAARAAAAGFRHGAVFVPLAATADPALVPTAIVQALGLLDDSTRLPMERLRMALGSSHLLLVLDNVEHLVAAGPDIVDLLTSCPELTVLVTSRVVLRVSGERVYPVQPMGLPAAAWLGSGGLPAPVTELEHVESVQLFMARAQAARADLALTPALAPTIAAICTRLEGLPLAIELAAARCAVLPPAAMLARLDQRLSLLTGGPRDQPSRLRTMRDAIAWSYDLLSPAERALFRRLSVFAGGFTLEDAEAMSRLRLAPADPEPGADEAPLDCFEALVSHSLVVAMKQTEPDAGAPAPEPRFTMLETIREFGREKLIAGGEDATTLDAHAALFLDLAESRSPAATPAAESAWLERMTAEIDNLRLALTRSIEQGDAGTALRLGAALSPLWQRRGLYLEGRAWLEQALALPDGPTAARTAALTVLSRLLVVLGEYDQTMRASAEAVALARAAGDQLGTARALVERGIAADRQADPAEAERCLGQALTVFRAAGDLAGVADALDHLGTTAWQQGDVARFAALADESLTLRRRLDDQIGIISGLDRLSLAAKERGDLAQQASLASEIVALTQQVDDPLILASTLWTAASIAGERGQALLSARLFGAEEALRQGIGYILDPAYVEHYVQVVQQIQAELGDTQFVAHWASGRGLTPDQALSEALTAMELLAAKPARASGLARDAAGMTIYGLTTRELQVLRLLVAGAPDKAIADKLFVARSTASKHVSSILEKLGAETRTAAAAIAFRDGLLGSE